jgi:hypothetical protein
MKQGVLHEDGLQIWSENLILREHLQSLGVDGKVILIWSLKNEVG